MSLVYSGNSKTDANRQLRRSWTQALSHKVYEQRSFRTALSASSRALMVIYEWRSHSKPNELHGVVSVSTQALAAAAHEPLDALQHSVLLVVLPRRRLRHKRPADFGQLLAAEEFALQQNEKRNCQLTVSTRTTTSIFRPHPGVRRNASSEGCQRYRASV